MTKDKPMSNEEVIEVLKGIVFGGFDRTTLKERQALDLAIKALEEPEEVYLNGKDYNLYLEGYKQGKKDFERPKGEWILEEEDCDLKLLLRITMF